VSPCSLTFSREQGLRQTFASSLALLAHYAMSRKIVVSSVSRQTIKDSDSVVAIGVADTESVATTAPADAFPMWKVLSKGRLSRPPQYCLLETRLT
jgi:hypothetical protein